MKIEGILDVFYYSGELWGLWTFSTGANIASDMLFLPKFFRLSTHITWFRVQNKWILMFLWKSFFLFGKNITFYIALTLVFRMFWPPLWRRIFCLRHTKVAPALLLQLGNALINNQKLIKNNIWIQKKSSTWKRN